MASAFLIASTARSGPIESTVSSARPQFLAELDGLLDGVLVVFVHSPGQVGLVGTRRLRRWA